MDLPAFKRLNLGDTDPAEDLQKLKELSSRITEMMKNLG